MTTLTHPGLMALRRSLAGEQLDEATTAHVGTCAECKARLESLRVEQRQFEAAVPFERFAQGVERATRKAPSAQPRRFSTAVVAVAASVLAVVGGARLLGAGEANHSRLKGGAGVELVVSAGPNGAQRVASEDPLVPEPLARGERLRVGVTPAAWHFALVLSVDACGTVTPIYASGEHSLPLSGASPEFLPDSLEFTGQGLEHVVVLLSDRALDVDVVAHELRRRYTEANGDLTKLAPLDVSAEQFHRTVLKP
jgi:hypothetical protein